MKEMSRIGMGLQQSIVLYPADKKSPNGKLRVLYEVFPMSGTSRWSSFYRKAKVDSCFMQALDLVPTKIHQRSPIFLGSYDDVEEIKALHAAEENNA
ncbi:unnamed protein product [Musa hybrid cultivar]